MKQKKKPLKQTPPFLIVECPDSTQLNDCAVCIEYVKSSLCTCTSCAHIHLPGVTSKTTFLQRTCKASKDEARSYCLSALATLWRIACTGTVLCCGRSLCWILWWEERRKCDDAVLVLTGEGTGQQCGMGNAKSPLTVECFSSLSQTEEPKDFNGKSSPLCVCA